VAIPSGGDGTWGLVLDIVAFNRLGGTAQIITYPDGQSFPGILHGTFLPGSGRSLLNLTGDNEGAGMSSRIELRNTQTGLSRDLVRGRVLGQVIRY
jgi:hypothetical protein